MKTKSFIPFILFPYVLVMDFFCISGSRELAGGNQLAEILIVAGAVILNIVEGIFTTISFFTLVKCLLLENDGEILKKAYRVKLFHIPFYLLMFFIGFGCFFLPMGFFLTFFCWLFDVMTIGISGTVVLLSLLQCLKDNSMEKKKVVLHGILSYIFCLDVIDSIYLLLKKRI